MKGERKMSKRKGSIGIKALVSDIKKQKLREAKLEAKILREHNENILFKSLIMKSEKEFQDQLENKEEKELFEAINEMIKCGNYKDEPELVEIISSKLGNSFNNYICNMGIEKKQTIARHIRRKLSNKDKICNDLIKTSVYLIKDENINEVFSFEMMCAYLNQFAITRRMKIRKQMEMLKQKQLVK